MWKWINRLRNILILECYGTLKKEGTTCYIYIDYLNITLSESSCKLYTVYYVNFKTQKDYIL